MAELLVCPYCKTQLPFDENKCPVCEENLAVAMLVCSKKIGPIERGFNWTLYPKDYSIGRSADNDIVIKDQFVSREHMKLVYEDGIFHVYNLSSNRPVEEDETHYFKNGDVILTGNGSLTIKYTKNFSKYSIVNSNSFLIALSTAYLINKTDDADIIYKHALDAVLRITGFEKAYFFTVYNDDENADNLLIRAARTSEFEDLEDPSIPISKSFLNKVLKARNEIILQAATDITKSIATLKLQSIACIPILDNKGKLRDIIYADSRNRISEQNLILFKPVMKILSKIINQRLEIINT